MSIVYNTRNIVYCNSKNFLRINYFKVINNFRTFKSWFVFKVTCSKALGNFDFYTKSLFSLKFFTTFGTFLLKRVNLNSNIRNGKNINSVLVFLVLFSEVSFSACTLQSLFILLQILKLLLYYFWKYDRYLYFSRFFIVNDRWII